MSLNLAILNILKPAQFEDTLEVKTKILNISKAKIEFNQTIYRENILLIDSKITNSFSR